MADWMKKREFNKLNKEQRLNYLRFKQAYSHGKNRYRQHMLAESRKAFEAMIGDDTISNMRKIDRAHNLGKTTCYHRPAVVKRHEKLERYLRATYTGKL